MRTILLRDLAGLDKQIAAYSSDDAVWQLAPGINNSAGTLALHVSGNIQHFIGAVLGRTGYERDREAEFARRGVPRVEIRHELQAAADAVRTTLPRVTAEQLAAVFPAPVGGRSVRTSDFLGHLVAHLAYHLGQVDFHRRLLDGGAALDVISPGELAAAAE